MSNNLYNFPINETIKDYAPFYNEVTEEEYFSKVNKVESSLEFLSNFLPSDKLPSPEYAGMELALLKGERKFFLFDILQWAKLNLMINPANQWTFPYVPYEPLVPTITYGHWNHMSLTTSDNTNTIYIDGKEYPLQVNHPQDL